MIIRIVSDGKNNPSHVDKLIVIEGLPEEWLFDRRKVVDDEGTEERLFLKAPWELDITDNIPEGIRFKFQPEPFTVWFETPMEIRPGTMVTNQKLEWIRWTNEGYGVRLNVQSNAGESMWQQIVDLMDRETPRHQKIPQAAIVGDKLNWHLTAAQVPHVKLTGSVADVPKEQIVKIEPKIAPRPDEYACQTCGDVFDRDRGRWMHERRKHGNKDAFIGKKVADYVKQTAVA
jgi:hypothetical protein